MKFGKVISSFRQRYNIEQKHLATALKISTNYLSLLENDKKKPSMNVLNSIATFFNVPVSMLLYEAAKNTGITGKESDKKIFEAAEPVLEMLANYLADGKTTLGMVPKKPRIKFKKEAV